MSSTENIASPFQTNFFEKVLDPNFSLVRFKDKLDEYKNRPTLVNLANNILRKVNLRQAILLLNQTLDSKIDHLETAEIFAKVRRITDKAFYSRSDSKEVKVFAVLNVVINRLDEICMLS